jgi:hypothetical protein
MIVRIPHLSLAILADTRLLNQFSFLSCRPCSECYDEHAWCGHAAETAITPADRAKKGMT